MQIPLYNRPNALLFLDDDPAYLEMLAIVMPRNWCVRLFTHANDCIDYLRKEHVLWEADLWSHQSMVDGHRSGAALIPKMLEYWQNHTKRYSLTKVYVVDYAMPAMNGLDMLKAIPNWPQDRVLLTGKADETIAVTAFNQGLINRFVPKQRPDIGAYLTQVLGGLRTGALPLYDAVWRSTLDQQQLVKLHNPVVVNWLMQFLLKHQWIEYVVISQPFGVLGLTAQGTVHWLQLEIYDDLASAADLAKSCGHSALEVADILEGRRLSNAELLMAMQLDTPASLANAMETGDGSQLLGAVFSLPGTSTMQSSYNQFIAAMPPRSASELA